MDWCGRPVCYISSRSACARAPPDPRALRWPDPPDPPAAEQPGPHRAGAHWAATGHCARRASRPRSPRTGRNRRLVLVLAEQEFVEIIVVIVGSGQTVEPGDIVAGQRRDGPVEIRKIRWGGRPVGLRRRHHRGHRPTVTGTKTPDPLGTEAASVALRGSALPDSASNSSAARVRSDSAADRRTLSLLLVRRVDQVCAPRRGISTPRTRRFDQGGGSGRSDGLGCDELGCSGMHDLSNPRKNRESLL